MKKFGYYALVVLEILALIVTIVLPFTYPVIYADCWQMLLSVTLGIPLLTLSCLGIERLNGSCHQGLFSVKQPIALPPTIPDTEEEVAGKENEADKSTEDIHSQEPAPQEECLEQKWSKAMYEHYNDQWDKLFANIERPLTAETKSQIALLLWEISSQAMNFLKQSNKDLNCVRYHTDGVRMIVDKLTLDDISLDKFYVDEETVYVKAIAIYEWLQEQGVKADTTAFGYRLKLQ